jgi:prophage antirepressor-like protein
MSNASGLVPFNYEDQPVRVVMIDGEPWFVLNDLCKVLDLSNPSMVAKRLDEGLSQAYPLPTAGGVQQTIVASEAGMYEVVLRSDKPEAVKFRRWITGTVLPEIRRTGSYGAAPLALPDRRALAQMVIEAEDRADAEHAARLEAEARSKELEPAASAWSVLASSAGDYAVGDAAKILSRDEAISIGRGRLFSFMAAEGWIFRRRAGAGWSAYQTQVDAGRLVEISGRPYLHEPSGESRLGEPTIRITPKGLAELHKRLGGTGRLGSVA